MKKFSRIVEDYCDDAFCALGAKRPRCGTLLFEVDKDVFCWVGLNEGKYDTFIRINPFIGIHNVPIMKLAAELNGKKYKKGDIATISLHLGELCPDIEEFIFQEGANLESEAARLAEKVHDIAIPWAEKYADLSNLLPKLESKLEMLGGYPERYAVALYLSNRKADVKQFIEKTQRKYAKEESEEINESFKSFSERLLKLMID